MEIKTAYTFDIPRGTVFYAILSENTLKREEFQAGLEVVIEGKEYIVLEVEMSRSNGYRNGTPIVNELNDLVALLVKEKTI